MIIFPPFTSSRRCTLHTVYLCTRHCRDLWLCLSSLSCFGSGLQLLLLLQLRALHKRRRCGICRNTQNNKKCNVCARFAIIRILTDAFTTAPTRNILLHCRRRHRLVVAEQQQSKAGPLRDGGQRQEDQRAKSFQCLDKSRSIKIVSIEFKCVCGGSQKVMENV